MNAQMAVILNCRMTWSCKKWQNSKKLLNEEIRKILKHNTSYRGTTCLVNMEMSRISVRVGEKEKILSWKTAPKLSQQLHNFTFSLKIFFCSLCSCVIAVTEYSSRQYIKWYILKTQGLPGLFLINVKQWLSTITSNSISMNLCLPYWKSSK